MRWDTERSESFSYQRVRVPRAGFDDGWQVVGDYPMFTGGRIEYSVDSDLVAVGELSFEGGEPPDPRDMVRVVYRAEDGCGGSAEVVLGTFIVQGSEPCWDMGKVSGTAKLLSVLHIPRSKLFPRPYTIGRGCNCVERARELIEGLGLRVSLSAGTRLLRRDIVMEAGESYLDAANRLLAAGGFAPCRPDAYGGVVMEPAPSGVREPAWELAEGDGSVMECEVALVDSAAGAPNAVHLSYEDGDGSWWVSAVNDDARSGSSVQAVGYEVGQYGQADDPGEGDVLESLKEQARRKLAEACSGTETAEVSHPVVPLKVGDVASASYPSSGIEMAGEVATMQVEWDENQHAAASSKIRRRVGADFVPTVRGGMLWQ